MPRMSWGGGLQERRLKTVYVVIRPGALYPKRRRVIAHPAGEPMPFGWAGPGALRRPRGAAALPFGPMRAVDSAGPSPSVGLRIEHLVFECDARRLARLFAGPTGVRGVDPRQVEGFYFEETDANQAALGLIVNEALGVEALQKSLDMGTAQGL